MKKFEGIKIAYNLIKIHIDLNKREIEHFKIAVF